MGHAHNKRERMEQVEQMLLSAPDGISVAEMASRLGCDPSTIHRYLQEIERENFLMQVRRGRYRLDPARYVNRVHLSTSESLSIYLALRRYIRQTTEAPRFMISALQKVTHTLRAPALVEKLRQASLALQRDRSASPERTDVWETLLRGWLEGVVVRISYRKAQTPDLVTHEIEPYLFEPALLSHGTYLIAWSRTRHALRTFKISRIQRASLTTSRFVPNDDLNIGELLKHAWGIWYNDEPTKVELLFAPQVAARVVETLRHPSETRRMLGDGSLYWTVEIGNPLELLPWIRGWGPMVEVLAPEDLRQRVAADMRAAAALYEE